MSCTPQTASQEMCALVKTAWVGASLDVTRLKWPNEPSTPPDGTETWARVSIQHASGEQTSLADATGRHRYQRNGTLTVQVFLPTGGGLRGLLSPTKVVMDALDGQKTPSGVWFKNVSPQEIGTGAQDGWYQINVKADFEYYEVK